MAMGLERTARLDPTGNRIALLLLRITQKYFIFFSPRKIAAGRLKVYRRHSEREKERERERERDIQLLVSAVGFIVRWQLVTSR